MPSDLPPTGEPGDAPSPDGSPKPGLATPSTEAAVGHSRAFELRASRILVYAAAGLAGILIAFVLGFFLVVKPIAARSAPAKSPAGSEQGAEAGRTGKKAATKLALPKPADAELARAKTQILVMNGSGARGAAQRVAAWLQEQNYAIAAIANAPTQNYRRTLVLYKRGMRGEAERLARDLEVPRRRVSPIDGMERTELQGAGLVLILGP